MLTYLVQVTEGLLLTAILTGMLLGFAKVHGGKTGFRISQIGCGVGWLVAILLAVLKNTTKLVDSGFWNLVFVAVYLVGLIAFAICLIPPLARKAQDKFQKIQAVTVALMLIGVTGYMAPEPLGYPGAIVISTETYISSDFFLRMLGWLLGLVIAFLISFSVCKVLSALGDPLAKWVPVAGSAFTGFVLFALASRALITRHIIGQNKALLQLAVFASNNNLLFCAVLGALAAICLIALVVRSLHVDEPYSNPAQHRKIRAKWRYRKRWAGVSILCLILAFATLTVIKDYDSREVELSPSEEFELREDGCYVSLEQLEDGHLHRFTYTSPDDVGIRFIIIKKPGGTAYGIGLDACDICGETGYYERNDQVVCKLCDVVMNVSTIGFKGGCNPIVIDYSIKDGYIIVPFDTLLEHEKIFTR